MTVSHTHDASEVRLRSASVDDCIALTELCIRSKSVWGYDETFMNTCHAELTLTADTLARSIVQIAEIGGSIVGMAEVRISGDVAELEKLFVDPTGMRRGLGRRLFDWAKQIAVAQGATMLMIESDPQAADFYRDMGAIDAGEVASTSIPNRFIPKLELQLR